MEIFTKIMIILVIIWLLPKLARAVATLLRVLWRVFLFLFAACILIAAQIIFDEAGISLAVGIIEAIISALLWARART